MFDNHYGQDNIPSLPCLWIMVYIKGFLADYNNKFFPKSILRLVHRED